MRNYIRSWKHNTKEKNIKQYGYRDMSKYDTEFMDTTDIEDDGKEEDI